MDATTSAAFQHLKSLTVTGQISHAKERFL